MGNPGRVLVPLTAVCLLGGLGVFGCDSGAEKGQGRESGDPFSVVEKRELSKAHRTGRVAYPYWRSVDVFRGSGRATRTFLIARDAIQWRVIVRCANGSLAARYVGSRQSPGAARPECPGAATALGLGSGRIHLHISGSGPWLVKIKQQLRTPIDEPPLR